MHAGHGEILKTAVCMLGVLSMYSQRCAYCALFDSIVHADRAEHLKAALHMMGMLSNECCEFGSAGSSEIHDP